MNKKLLRGYLFVIVSAFLFGCMPLITTYIYKQNINRESVVLLRNLLALPALGVLAAMQQKSVKKVFCISGQAFPKVALIALMGCCVTPLLLYASYEYIATGTATVFHFVYPAVVVIIGLLFLRKKASGGTMLAVGLCVVGICLFYNPNEPLNLTGCILALVSGVTYAIYVVLLAGFKDKSVNGFKLSFWVSMVCAAVMLAVCLATGKLTMPESFTGWLLCILLALVINVGAVVLFQQGTFLIGGERASILSTVEPLTGMVVGIVHFGDPMYWGSMVGSVLVIAASILIALADSKKEKH